MRVLKWLYYQTVCVVFATLKCVVVLKNLTAFNALYLCLTLPFSAVTSINIDCSRKWVQWFYEDDDQKSAGLYKHWKNERIREFRPLKNCSLFIRKFTISFFLSRVILHWPYCCSAVLVTCEKPMQPTVTSKDVKWHFKCVAATSVSEELRRVSLLQRQRAVQWAGKNDSSVRVSDVTLNFDMHFNYRQ